MHMLLGEVSAHQLSKSLECACSCFLTWQLTHSLITGPEKLLIDQLVKSWCQSFTTGLSSEAFTLMTLSQNI